MLGWTKRREEEMLKQLSAMRRASYSDRALLLPLGIHDSAIFRIRPTGLDDVEQIELNAHIELCRKRHYRVSVEQATEEIPFGYIGFADYYYKGIQELRLCLKKPEVNFAKTI